MNVLDPIADAVVAILKGAAFATVIPDDVVALGLTWEDGESKRTNRALVRPLSVELPSDPRLRTDTSAQVTCQLEIVWEYADRGGLQDAMQVMADALAEAFGDGGPTLYSALGSSDVAGGALRCELGIPLFDNQPDPSEFGLDEPDRITARWPLSVRAWVTL